MLRRFVRRTFGTGAVVAGLAVAALAVSGCRASEDQPPGTANTSAIETADTSRVEQFVAAAVTIEGREIRVSGQRFASVTIVEIELPDGILIPGTPALIRDGERVGPVVGEPMAAGSRYRYPPTPFGTPVTVELGSFAIKQEDSGPTITLAMGEALARANGSEAFAISPADILDGPRELVLSGERGRYAERDWVGVVLDGNWEPVNGKPQVFDQDGKQLDLAHIQVGYTKDATGTVQPGTTNVAAFVDDVSKLKTVTIVLGKPSRLEAGGHLVELSPEK